MASPTRYPIKLQAWIEIRKFTGVITWYITEGRKVSREVKRRAILKNPMKK
jgi:hypothetical protein